MPGPGQSAEDLAAQGLQQRSIADDPFELAQKLAAQRQGQAAPPQDVAPEPEGPGFLSGIMDMVKGALGGGEEAPAAPPASTALSVALEKTRLGLPLTPEEQAAMGSAGP